jgi:hypothetical protein
MADKDKKLRVILKLPSKSSSNSKAGISGASASPGVTSHKVHASSVVGSETPSKLSPRVAGSTANTRVATPPKKRKFKTLIEGDAKDDQGGLYGAAITTVTAPPIFKAPLPPLAKKSSHKVTASIVCWRSVTWILGLRLFETHKNQPSWEGFELVL